MEVSDKAEGPSRLALGLVVVAAVTALWLLALNEPDLTRSYGRDPGPAFQPLIILFLLAVSALILILDGLRRIRQSGWDITSTFRSLADFTVPLLLVASLAAFVMIVRPLGFLATSLLFSVSWAVGLAAQDAGYRPSRALLTAAIGGGLVAVAVYLIFERVIGVPLP